MDLRQKISDTWHQALRNKYAPLVLGGGIVALGAAAGLAAGGFLAGAAGFGGAALMAAGAVTGGFLGVASCVHYLLNANSCCSHDHKMTYPRVVGGMLRDLGKVPALAVRSLRKSFGAAAKRPAVAQETAAQPAATAATPPQP